MLANRISFFFNLNGPSINIDSNCCGGATALQKGFMAIQSGLVENAIIGASNVIINPQMSLQLFLLGKYDVLTNREYSPKIYLQRKCTKIFRPIVARRDNKIIRQ